VKKEWK